jgi:hypothetical protein
MRPHLAKSIKTPTMGVAAPPTWSNSRRSTLHITTFLGIFLVVGSCICAAQDSVSADQTASLTRKFEQQTFTRTMKCEFRPTKPFLNFGLVHETGYAVRFPGGEFDGYDGKVEFALRLTSLSEARAPSFISDILAIPKMSDPSQYIEVSSRFAIDPGTYKIEAVATDHDGRVCRGEWNLDIARRAVGATHVNDRTPSRVAIFLNAAPLNLRNTTLQPPDIVMLAGAVLSLTKRFDRASFRLVVFSLNSETEALRYGSFARSDLSHLIDGLRSIRLGTIDYGNLKGNVGPAKFLGHLVENEMAEPEKPDVVVFLGPVSHVREDVMKKDVLAAVGSKAAFYYLEYRPPQGLADWDSLPSPSSPPAQRTTGYAYDYPRNPLPIGIGPAIAPSDTIQHLMGRLGGRTIAFSTPEEFESAMEKLVPARAR